MTDAPMEPTLGELVSAARQRAGLTLRGLQQALRASSPLRRTETLGATLSAQFLHDVEHGRRDLPVTWWRAFAAVLPGVTVTEMAEARARTGTVKLRAGELTEAQRAGVVEALVREAGGGSG